MNDSTNDPALLTQAIRRCNEFLWVYQYPAPRGGLLENSEQHRDLVRTFFAGFMEGADAGGDYKKCLPLMAFFQDMTAPAWLPGKRFRRPAEALS